MYLYKFVLSDMAWYIFCFKYCIEVIMVLSVSSYNLKCPNPSQWNIRASELCNNSSNTIYTCLFDHQSSSYKEYCGLEEFSMHGTKYILMPNPQQVSCARSFYQPFKFTTIENSRCMFMKSTCNEQGQVKAKGEFTISDRSCRCDYTRGYMFVTPPRNKCTCMPSQEDCSCVLKPCTGYNEKMGRDYKCYSEYKTILPERIPCEDIVFKKNRDVIYRPYISKNVTEWFIIRSESSAFAQLLIVVLLVVIMIFGILIIDVCPSAGIITVTTQLNIRSKVNNNNFKVLIEDNVTLQCDVESLFGIKSVKWYRKQHGKLYDIDVSNQQNKYAVSGIKSRSLTINRFNSDDTVDSGTYFCLVRNYIGLQNETMLRLSTLLSHFHKMKPISKYLQDLPAFAVKEQSFTTIETLKCFEKRKKSEIIESDVKLEVSAENVSSDIQVIWLKRSEKLSIIRPHHRSVLYRGGGNDDPSLIIKDCNVSDTGDYICVMLDSEENVVNNSYLLFHAEVNIKPSWHFPEELMKKGSLDDVVRILENTMFGNRKGEQQFPEIDFSYQILLQRLADESVHKIKLVRQLFQKIYEFWLKDMASNNTKRRRPYFPAWDLILFVEKLATVETIPWIFDDSSLDYVLLCGLILAAKNNYLINRRDLFELLLERFQQSLEGKGSERFLEAIGSDFDNNKNTFFHYIAMFGSQEATIVLNKSHKLLTKDNRDRFCRSNSFNKTPLEFSAFLGKYLVFKTILVNTKYTNKKKDNLQRFIKEGLKQRLEPNVLICASEQSYFTTTKSSNCKMDQGPKTGSDISKTSSSQDVINVNPEVAEFVVYGTKDEYLQILNLLSQSKLNKKVIKQKLKEEFIKSDIFRSYLIL